MMEDNDDHVGATSSSGVIVRPKFEFVLLKNMKGEARGAGKSALSFAEQSDLKSNCDYIRVELPKSIDGRMCGAMLKALIQHLLYIRRQTPIPYSELENYINGQILSDDASDGSVPGKRKRLTTSMRKCLKLHDALKKIFSSLESQQQSDVNWGMIAFGSTILNPREVYLIRFDTAAIPEPCNNLQEEAGACIRKLMRALITSSAECMHTDFLPTNMHILLRTPRNHQIEGFLPRPSFHPKLRRVRPLVISVGTKYFCDIANTSIEQLSTVVDDPRYIWLQAQHAVQGLHELQDGDQQ